MKNIDSQLQREANHREVRGNATFLCKVFSALFPATLDYEKGSLRLKVFSKIASLGFIDCNDKTSIKKLEEFQLFNTRSTKKKIIEAFVNAGLIEKGDFGIYTKTNIGEAAWQSILNFLETYKPIEQQVTEEGGKVYEYNFWKITVDEKGNSHITRNFGIRNLAEEPLKEIEHSAFSTNKRYEGMFKLQHSENIQDYELTQDEDFSKKFRLNFKNPIKKGEYAEFWIKYNWPEQYGSNIDWQHSCYSTKSFIREFMLEFNFPPRYKLDKESIRKNNEGGLLPKDSIVFDPVITDNSMVWRIRNVYPKRKYILTWKRKI